MIVFVPSERIAQAHRMAWLCVSPNRLVDAVQEQVHDVVILQIALGKGFVLGVELLRQAADRGARQKRTA